jgi:hypothetical protein
MSSPLSTALALDRRLDENIAAINARIRTLDDQMRLADEIIADMQLDQSFYHMRDDDDFSHFSISTTDSDSDDDETVEYRTMDDNLFFEDEDEDDQSDCETVVEKWVDTYVTPDRAMRGIDVPDNLENGLDFLLY